jgi:hypothetical protein
MMVWVMMEEQMASKITLTLSTIGLGLGRDSKLKKNPLSVIHQKRIPN